MNNQNGCGCQSVTSAPSCTCNSGFNTSFVLILVLYISGARSLFLKLIKYSSPLPYIFNNLKFNLDNKIFNKNKSNLLKIIIIVFINYK